MGRSALFTTEGDLDMEGVYSRALASRQSLDEKLTALVNTKEKKRAADHDLALREIELMSAFKAANSSKSQTAIDKEIKSVHHADDQWNHLRDEVGRLAGEIDALEADVSVLKRDIQIGTSRMMNLGGYFFFLGSEKLASE